VFRDASDTHLLSEAVCRLAVSPVCEVPRLTDDVEYLRVAVKRSVNIVRTQLMMEESRTFLHYNVTKMLVYIWKHPC
jgi:hypothetical protein